MCKGVKTFHPWKVLLAKIGIYKNPIDKFENSDEDLTTFFLMCK